jgi:alpha/beta superfamily hydrolase
VCRFNFRGVGDSGGSPSFTGEGEKDDLSAVCSFLLDGAAVGGERLCNVHSIILVGYSYGSIIAGAAADEIPAVKAVCAVPAPCRACAWMNAHGKGARFV